MKRFASLAALLMTLVLALSLAACGDKNTADDSNQTTDQPATTQPADDGNAAQTNGDAASDTTGSVDLAALRDQIIADCGYTDTLPIETAMLENTYGITADQVKSSASFNATVGTAFPDEIVMVEATDAAAAQDVASKLTNRLSAIADQAASYDPDSEALAKKCEVVTSGNYVGMFFSSHYDEMVSAFQNAVG